MTDNTCVMPRTVYVPKGQGPKLCGRPAVAGKLFCAHHIAQLEDVGERIAMKEERP